MSFFDSNFIETKTFSCKILIFKAHITCFAQGSYGSWNPGFLFCKIKDFKGHRKLYFNEKSLHSPGKLLFDLY